MRFLGKSLSALFAFLFLFLAGNSVTTSAFAKEASSLGNTQGKEVCPLKNLITLEESCKSKPAIDNSKDFLPIQTLTRSEIPEKNKEPKQPQKNNSQLVLANTFNTATEATLSADLIFSMVNNHRAKIGKTNLEKDSLVCSAAESRLEGIRKEIFVTGALHSGFLALNLPYQAVENMIWQNSESQAVSWWLNSPIHRSAIEGNYKYACGVCNGKVCNMVFTNYDPKVIVKAPVTSSNTTN